MIAQVTRVQYCNISGNILARTALNPSSSFPLSSSFSYKLLKSSSRLFSTEPSSSSSASSTTTVLTFTKPSNYMSLSSNEKLKSIPEPRGEHTLEWDGRASYRNWRHHAIGRFSIYLPAFGSQSYAYYIRRKRCALIDCILKKSFEGRILFKSE